MGLEIMYKSTNKKKLQNKAVDSGSDEFKPGVTDDFRLEQMPEVSRRKFLAMLGAATAFAGTACTDYRDKGEIIPYTRKPEDMIIGTANYYASTCNACALRCGTLIKTREGRPIKILGNSDHPVNKGKICAVGESNILNLYDPERLQNPTNIKGSSLLLFKNDVAQETWVNADKEIIALMNKALSDNKEIAFVANT
jgi:hypothetical protein